MRDYYQPRLLPRLLSGQELPKIRPLQNLNRVQPVVQIKTVQQGASADLAQVVGGSVAKRRSVSAGRKNGDEEYGCLRFAAVPHGHKPAPVQ